MAELKAKAEREGAALAEAVLKTRALDAPYVDAPPLGPLRPPERSDGDGGGARAGWERKLRPEVRAAVEAEEAGDKFTGRLLERPDGSPSSSPPTAAHLTLSRASWRRRGRAGRRCNPPSPSRSAATATAPPPPQLAPPPSLPCSGAAPGGGIRRCRSTWRR